MIKTKLNLFLNGEIHLDKFDADMTLLVAPFKSFDTLVSKVPLIGKPIMGGYDSLLAVPVAIRGPMSDPLITPLDPKAVSGTLFNIVKETFMLPYNILLQDSNEGKNE
ncbi:AsmA-like C-terminal domain-containing protein [Thermodesulfobacteriota bacterium]